MHKILVKGADGKFHKQIVSDEEFTELNTPKCSTTKGKYDSDVKRYDCHFASDICNQIFGNR